MEPNEVKQYYIKGEYYDWVTQPRRLEKIFHRRRERTTVELFHRHHTGSVVLDAGCGTGLITLHLQGTVIGIDINEWNLKRAKEHAPKGNYVQADIESLPIISRSIDTVVCTETLEHLPQPEQAVREFARVLKPGGKLIISIPNKHIIWKFRKFLLTTCPVSEPFHRSYTMNEFKRLLHKFTPIAFCKGVFGLTIFAVVQKPPRLKGYNEGS